MKKILYLTRKHLFTGFIMFILLYWLGSNIYATEISEKNGVQGILYEEEHSKTNTRLISELNKKNDDIEIKMDIAKEIRGIAEEKIIAVAISNESIHQDIADYACSFVGWLPYVWAGASLETGADCCGFTMAIYNHFGFDIPRTVDGQAVTGYSVTRENALPGDIIIYSGHVGLYIGNGQVVHSPHTGTTVSIDNIDMMPVWDIRRVF